MIYLALIAAPILAFVAFIWLLNFCFTRYTQHNESRHLNGARKKREWDFGVRK